MSLKLFWDEVSKLNGKEMWRESQRRGRGELIVRSLITDHSVADPSSLTIISNHQTLQTCTNIFLSKRVVKNL